MDKINRRRCSKLDSLKAFATFDLEILKRDVYVINLVRDHKVIKTYYSQKVFHFDSNLQKWVPNHFPEHLFIWIVLRGVIWQAVFQI